MNATEIQAEKAIEKLEFVIRAAKNGNQGGENAVVKYARAFRAHDDLVEATINLVSLVRAHTGGDDGIANAAIRAAEDALSKARGEQP